APVAAPPGAAGGPVGAGAAGVPAQVPRPALRQRQRPLPRIRPRHCRTGLLRARPQPALRALPAVSEPVAAAGPGLAGH
nr:hypothetical protein [Tanacetum cinerariifolium]